MKSIRLMVWVACFGLAYSEIALGVSSRKTGAPSTANPPVSLAVKMGYKPGTKLAEVWPDWRLTDPTAQNVAHIQHWIIVPRYIPQNLPYNPADPNTSPLEAPSSKGGRAYYGEKTFRNYTPESLFHMANPALSNPSDKVGFGRAFNIPDQLVSQTAGNAPLVLVNLATDACPPDFEAIAAAQVQTAAPLAHATGNLDVMALPFSPVNIQTLAVATQPGTNESAQRPQSSTQATSQPDPKTAVASRLASAFVAEDAQHGRANLPILARQK